MPFLFSFSTTSTIHLLILSTSHLLFRDCPHVSLFFHSCSVFPLLFYLVPVNRSVVRDLVITLGSVWLLADCCRGLCWPDAGVLSQAAGFAVRGNVLCLPECAHCHPLQHTPSILYFPVRDLHPSVIPLSSVPQTEGFLTGRWRGGGGRAEAREQNCHCGDD